MIFQKYLPSASLLLGILLILQAPWTLSADDLAQGEHLFQLHCAICHGLKGEGGRGPTLAVPRLSRAPTEALLIEVIRDGIPGTEMPLAGLDRDQIRQVAIWVRTLGQLPSEQVLGNAQRGEQLYFTKGYCAQCHAIKGQGGAFGPDLTDIGLRRSAGYLRTSLTDPEADVPKSFSMFWGVNIPENFLQVRVLTKDGQQIIGVRLNEDTFSIQVRDPSDRIYSFFKSELAELHKDWGKSPMPSYRDIFSKTELDDVVAFLVSLRGEK